MNQQQINMLNSPNMKHNQVNGVNVNGRVDLLSPNTSTLFSMTDRIPLSKSTDFRDAMKGNYKVKIYCDGQTIGSDSFTLK